MTAPRTSSSLCPPAKPSKESSGSRSGAELSMSTLERSISQQGTYKPQLRTLITLKFTFSESTQFLFGSSFELVHKGLIARSTDPLDQSDYQRFDHSLFNFFTFSRFSPVFHVTFSTEGRQSKQTEPKNVSLL